MASFGLEIHDHGNLWYSFTYRRQWRDSSTRGWIPLGYSATRYSEDRGWIRLTVKQGHGGRPLYNFLTHEGDELETVGDEATQAFVFMRQAAGIDDEGLCRWKRSFGLPLEDVDESTYCGRRKMVEDACLAAYGDPSSILGRNPKLLWLNPTPMETVAIDRTPISTRTRQKRLKK